MIMNNHDTCYINYHLTDKMFVSFNINAKHAM